MPAPDAALAYYRTQQQLAAQATTAARMLWSRMVPADFDASWAVVGPRLQALLTVTQARAATNGVAYVPSVLAEQGIDQAPDAEVLPGQLAGVASSGGDITDLLYSAVIQAKLLAGKGLAGPMALQQARRHLDGVMLTQVADAGRVAVGLATVATPHVGYVRLLRAPSCSRCVILAGKFYGPLEGFQRHPRCDCVHVPTMENLADDLRTDPSAYFDSLTPATQDATFGKAGAQAIRDGADMNRVVNARKGVYTASAYGRTVRATHSRAIGGRAGKALRLMPEQIYKDAGSRAEALRLLRLHGYVT